MVVSNEEKLNASCSILSHSNIKKRGREGNEERKGRNSLLNHKPSMHVNPVLSTQPRHLDIYSACWRLVCPQSKLINT